MKILCISHSYPPIMGGVESQNYNLFQGLGKIAETKIIANGKGKIFLPIFLPLTFLKMLFLMSRYDVCLVGNGVLAPLAAFVSVIYPKKKFFSVVHGLDITFAGKKGILSKIYKFVNIPALKMLDKLFMVGNPTVKEAVKIGISRDHCEVIYNGVNIEDLREKHTREELEKIWGESLENKKLILRLARFVPHKGTSWFIQNVMPRLPENVVMIATGYRVGKNTAGDKDNFPDCEKAIKDNQLENRVKLLPNLPQEDLKVLLNTADIVVSPNVKTPGSMEGFGINVIEAAACERVVVASNLEGLAEAIRDNQNGFLVEESNIDAWVNKITEILNKDESFRIEFGKCAGKYVAENLSWNGISKKYLEEMSK